MISYPPGLSANPTIVFRANYQQNGIKTIAVNDLTLTSQNATPDPVVVWLPPSLVKAGDKASFPLLFAGVAPYSLQWIKGGSDITNATGESYEINKVVAADEALSWYLLKIPR